MFWESLDFSFRYFWSVSTQLENRHDDLYSIIFLVLTKISQRMLGRLTRLQPEYSTPTGKMNLDLLDLLDDRRYDRAAERCDKLHIRTGQSLRLETDSVQ